MGDSLDPDEVSALLGIEPTLSYRKGDTRLTRHGKEVVHRAGLWSLDVQDKTPEDLNSQIPEILGQLTQDLGIWRALASRYRIDFFCGLFMEDSNEGVSLVPATLRAVAERGIEIGLDVYAPEESDGETTAT